ncbi:hypothetical protein GCM10010172_05950 [Paractinoplanes ferrugineus]|uniref:Tyr recombinase domain-containing protein n=1 Tax=Paractinoplanes ferrugineus TaxID=113564 RepID=A0A919J220_9ACTN|nr:tyrosine-type recombinase/integrase [Actinoplanes ferrugineus]GIE12488.1 hypothetical protein Afe05nite_43280 [Actinoplanes ferrugineus]
MPSRPWCRCSAGKRARDDDGGPLSYDAARHRWTRYRTTAGVDLDIHQLRHSHATALINAGVSIEAVRRRLGPRLTETTQLYALLNDEVAADEIRAARRRARARDWPPRSLWGGRPIPTCQPRSPTLRLAVASGGPALDSGAGGADAL